MPTSQKSGCSRFTRPGKQRDSLDEETTDWRAVCGKTARTVRRAGSVQADPDPYHNHQDFDYRWRLPHRMTAAYGSPLSRGRQQQTQSATKIETAQPGSKRLVA